MNHMKSIFGILTIFLFHFFSSVESLRIRKNLNALSTPQYNQYHILMRLLFICQPNQNDKLIFKQIYVEKGYYKPIIPKSLFDVLFVMHSTSCIHRSEFFPYWHRTLILKFETFLEYSHNFAVQLSQNSTLVDIEAQRLHGVALSNQLASNLSQIKEYLIATIKDYKNTISQLPEGRDPKNFIAAHYWNTMDYRSKITYAKGFYRQSAINQMNKTEFKRKDWDIIFQNADRLIKLIYDQDGIFQLNFKTRWYEDQILKALDIEKGGLINLFQIPPTRAEAQGIIQNEDFWLNPDDSSMHSNTIGNWLLGNNTSGAQPLSHLLYHYLTEKQKKRRYFTVFESFKMQLNTYDDFDVNFIFGGKGNEFIKRDGKTAKLRNNLLPYSMYAKSLKTKPYDFMRKFLSAKTGLAYSLENAHNFMHNFQIKMSSNALLSPINPIFYPFHSFIDALLEIKIKMINLEKDPSSEPNSCFDAISGVQEFMQEDFDIKENFDKSWAQFFRNLNQRDPKNKDGPIFLWKKSNSSSLLSQNDFILATDRSTGKALTYYETVVQQKKGRKKLRQLQSFSQATYDFNLTDESDPFISALNQIIDQSISPYPNQGQSKLSLWVRLDSYQIGNKQVRISIQNKKGKTLEVRNITLTRQSLNFDMFDFNNNYFKKMKIMERHTDKDTNHQIFRPKFSPSSLITCQTSEKQAKISYRVGRKKVEVAIKGVKGIERVTLAISYIKDDPLSSKDIETRQYTIYSDQVQNNQVYGRSGYLIQKITGKSGPDFNRTIEYEFSLFSESSVVILNFHQPTLVSKPMRQLKDRA